MAMGKKLIDSRHLRKSLTHQELTKLTEQRLGSRTQQAIWTVELAHESARAHT